MHLSELIQRQGAWHFDLRSAIIGALIAWILAGLAYSIRAAIQQQIERLWQPIAAWRRRARASQEEKYARALRSALTPRLLFSPPDPGAVFVQPTYTALAPLPTSVTEVAQSPRTLTVSHKALLDGHRQLLITGPLGSGRTTSLVVCARQVTEVQGDEDPQPYARIPVWIDLDDYLRVERSPKDSALDHLASVAAEALPGLMNRWLVRHLRNEPALLLVDNWEHLNQDQRTSVANWVSEAGDLMADAVWLVTTGTSGYGPLIEKGFVAAQLQARAAESDLPQLYAAWQAFSDNADMPRPGDDVLDSLAEAVRDGAPLWEVHARIALHLAANELPVRPVEVMAYLLDAKLDAVSLGRSSEEIAEDARALAIETLVALASAHRLEHQDLTNQEVHDTIERILPPKTERPRRLEGAVQRLIARSGLLRQDRRAWVPSHWIWTDYLTAVHLVAQEDGLEIVRAHLHDPEWMVLSEFVAGIADVGDLAAEVVALAEIEGDRAVSLRAARWAAVANPEQPWRTSIIKTLAQGFVSTDVTEPTRLDLGHALFRVAGTGARAFFLKMLKSQDARVRAAALRGLGWCGESRDMQVMGAALRDADPATQRSGVGALVDLGTPGAIKFLADRLPEVNETLMLEISEALAQLPEAWATLGDYTLHPDLMVRRAATLALGQVAEVWAEDRLVEIGQEDTQWIVRAAAEAALQAREERAGRGPVVSAPPKIDELAWLITWAARNGMGLGVAEAARETLLQATQDGSVDDKILGALTLAHIGKESDRSALEMLSVDLNPDVQEAARWASERIKQRYRFPAPVFAP